MKFRQLLFVCVLVAAAFAGCVIVDDTGQTTTEEPATHGITELTYISGHFGSYWDCPEEAYTADASGESSEPIVDGDMDWGACPPEEPNCSVGFMNCQHAQVTVRIANIGDGTLTGINVSDIILLTSDGEPHTSLPILTITALDEASLNAGIAPGSYIDVRVDFRAPQDPVSFLDSDPTSGISDRAAYGARLRVVVDADENAPADVDTPDLYSQPAIDT